MEAVTDFIFLGSKTTADGDCSHEIKRHSLACSITKYTILHDPTYYIAHQAPLSMTFPRQEYWSRLSFPSAGDLPDPGVEHTSSALAGGFLTTEPPETPFRNT